MARPIALHARVSMSRPERRLVAYDRHGRVVDDPRWVSLDVLVETQLDDGSLVSTPEPTRGIGRPLDCSRRELEENVRDLIFQQPRYLPGERGAEPAQLVSELQAHGIDTTLEALAALPLTIVLTDEVEARLEARESNERAGPGGPARPGNPS